MEKKISATVSNSDNGLKLESFLKTGLHLTRQEISRAKFRENGICVNHRRQRVSALLKTGDFVEVLLETGDTISEKLILSEKPLSVLYEDADIIVVNKPAGISVHPAGRKDCDTLANRLAFYLQSRGEPSVIRIFGRLDKDTSGVVLAVKNRPAATRLERQRDDGLLYKTYLAIAEHAPNPACGKIDAPIGNHPEKRNQMCVTADGKPAATCYNTLAVTENGFALLELRLMTGRTHQIRVHTAHIGCPLLGDSIYGEGPVSELSRTALHARAIHLRQPFTGEELLIEAPIPEDMHLYCSEMRSDARSRR